MKDKLPAFQFYPGDWRKDPGVQSLSFHDRGVWFEILCLMHESGERGKLMLNGAAMPEDALARLLGLDNQILTKALTNLLTYGVASRCPDTGALVNRRMVADEKLRKIRQKCGKKGGNPNLLNQTSNQIPTTQVNQIPTPSSSSSSSDVQREREASRPKNLDEVLTYAAMQAITSEDATAFFDHFEASGWIDGQNRPVADWRAKARSWKTRSQAEKEKDKRRFNGGKPEVKADHSKGF